MSKKIYRAAAIGRTDGGNYGHGLHLPYKELDNVQFIAVADANDAGREKAKADAGALRAYADYHEMLAQEEIDIVSVCPRWTDCHLEMVLACIEAECHIYCEKPIAMNLSDGDTMVAAADNAGLKIAVSHQQVYQPATQKIKRMLDEGRIGQVHSIYTHGKQDNRGGGEDMIVLGTHTFNMMRYFFGDVAWMFSHITTDGHELTPNDVHKPTEPVGLVSGDSINSYFAFKSGVSGFFYSRRYRERYGTKIMGSEGIMSFSGDNLIISPNPDDASGKEEIVELGSSTLHEGNKLAIIDLIDAIDNDREPISSGRGAVAALEMILGAYESQITGKRVAFPMENRTHPLERFR
ncbi:Gfo/Idh/MocA family oxidoreductase [Candidatus Poribacteria bacterium]|nr:Gfo/Idh/MocA family oxidoreductase [Candidatus Poribacteria bacterium]